MKIAVVGDIHIGGSQALGKTDPITQLNTRLLDFISTFDGLIDEFYNRNVKIIVLTGDCFDSRFPHPSQLNALSKSLQRATSKGMKILIDVGNHDQSRTTGTTTVDVYNSLSLPNIVSFPEFGVHTINDNGKNINFVMMPYRDRKMIEGAKTKQDAIDKIKEKIDLMTTGLFGRIVGIGHFMAGEAVSGESSETFSMDELVLPLDLFSKFDATFIGHVHTHQILRKTPPIMYVGSMEKITFGDKAHKKVSVVLDTDDMSIDIIPTKVRELFEINLDYSSGDKYYKHQITDQIVSEIEEFSKKNILDDSIVKIIVKVKENDLYYVNQERIKEYIMDKKVNYLSPMQLSAVSFRKLRNKNITENVNSKRAMKEFIKNLNESETAKNKLLKFAEIVISEVEGK